MKSLRVKNRKGFKRIVAIATSAAILLPYVFIPELKNGLSGVFNIFTKVYAEVNTVTNIEKTNLKDLYLFSEEYHNHPEAYPRLNLTIGFEVGDGNNEITSTKVFDGDELTWYPFGTKSHPFDGRIVIDITRGVTQPIITNAPLFGYVTDTVEIVNVNTDPVTRKYTFQDLLLLRTEANDEAPLFAEHIVHDSEVLSLATWNLNIEAAQPYGGIIGDVGEDSASTSVHLNLRLDASGTVSTSQNAGLVCGAIYNDSSVNVNFSTAGSVSSVNVTSTGKCAGAFVGEMYPGSEIDIIANGAYDISSAARTITGKTYAGSLVGKNNQGTVKILSVQLDENNEPVTDENENNIYDENSYEALGTVKATDGAAGGVFGYFKVRSDDNRFSPDYYKSGTGCTLNGKTAGGLVGVLDGNGVNISYSGTSGSNRASVVTTLSGSHTTFGGIVGTYSNDNLSRSFTAEHTTVSVSGGSATNYGGAIGKLEGNSALYVYANDFQLNSTGSVGSCTYFGGAIGSAGSQGSMLDIGDITVSTSNAYKGGGVVGQLSAGVLRLSGTTNLSGASASSGGQIVGERNNALVYALGSGNATAASYGNDWRLIRSSDDVPVDDIGTWGEVVRIAKIEESTEEIPAVEADPEADPPIEGSDAVPAAPAIVSFDSVTHKVTVASAVTDMASPRDFVRTALNMQLNDGSSGCIIYDSGSNRSNLLANKNLTVSGTIDLRGTGITGFMRDDSLSAADTEIKFFTGKLSKQSEADSAAINLAVGERYGVISNGNDTYSNVTDSNSTGRGAIHTHRFNGLFARTGDTAAIENITIDGVMNIRSNVADFYAGGAIAYLKDSATLTSVNAKEHINYYYTGAEKTERQYLGGLIGVTNCSAGKKVTIQGTSSTKALISPTITVTGTCLDNMGAAVNQCFGGAIGYIRSVAGTVASQTATEIKYVTLSANIDASGATTSAANISAAGLIADIAWDTSDSAVDSDRDTKKLILSNIDVKQTVVKAPATDSTGGILGYRWFSTDVELGNVSLSADTADNEINTPAKYIGGLVYKATGNWYVPAASGITINSLDIKNGNSTAAPTSLGIIVHNGYYSKSGLFLELANKDSYSLASSGLTIPNMTGKVYDELVAYLASSSSNLLLNNKSGIISYKTNGIYNMSNSRNSYNNKYNTTVVNNKSRYYYNADRISYSNNSSNSSKDSYKLLYWSLNRYAAANLKRCFTNPFSDDVLSGTFDLNHVSYYPIDIEDDVTIGDATFVFYNDDIETTETASNTKRSTRNGYSQHYLMHMGLFKNVSATIETTGDIIMYGSVGVNDTYSGALINGTLTGSLNTAKNKNITLGETQGKTKKYPLILAANSGVGINERFLLINSIGSNAQLDLNGVGIDEGNRNSPSYDTSSGTTFASSLIGDVQGTGITLNFSNIKFDARNKEDVVTTLDDVYGTTRSIFKNAMLLNKYDVDSTSVAIYNFAQSEDWDDDSEEHIGLGESPYTGVTYGKELTSSVSYAGEEDRYYEDGENGNYIDPVTYPGAFVSGSIANDDRDHPYDFSSDFLPYVRYYNASVEGAPSGNDVFDTLREIKVNVVPSDLSEGCGTYDHPYEIGSPKQMNSLALMLENADSTTPSNNIPYVRLPLSTAAGSASHWCLTDATTHSCHLYKYNTTLDKYEYRINEDDATAADSWNAEDVRAYLAGAYYQTGSLSLDGNFHGLGGFDSRYAFKGVLIGKNNSTTITNNSGKPLIKISNGSVIKRLNIIVDNYDSTNNEYTSVVTSGSVNTAFSYSDNDLVYGGVIGKIMGGDNIIDKVSVTYNSNGYIQVEGSNHYLYCVGGYVGAIVNGGLIFRNMSTMGAFKVNTESSASNNFAASTDNTHLYINPYIGRVINGYAIYETNKYSADSVSDKKYYDSNGKELTDVVDPENDNRIADTVEVIKYYDSTGNELADVTDPENDDRIAKTVPQFKYDSTATNYTLNNSTKNYQIANVNANSANKITFGTYDSKNTIDIPDGQSLFILSLITQSGAGTASSANGNYAYAVSYDGTEPYWANVNNTSTACRIAAQNVSTHLARYDKVGSAVFADKTDQNGDYWLSKRDTNSSKTAVPYIIYKYTAGSGTSYTARSITYPGNTFIMRLTTQNSNYNLPESFRGIGSICTLHGGLVGESARANDEDGKYALELYGFDGNGATIDINLKFNAYGQSYDNYIKTVYGENYNSQADGNHTGINVGFGLFNYVLQKKSSNNITYNTTPGYYIGNFTLSGSVDVKEYKNNATQMDADTTVHNKSPGRLRSRYAIGGVISSILANDYVNLYQLDLKNLKVSGTSMVGGYIGKCNLTGRDSSKGNGRMKIYVNDCDTENLELISRGGYCGGITAGYAMGFLDIYINTSPDSNSTMNISITNTTNCAQSGTGGVIGTCMTGLNDIWINNVIVSGMKNKAYIKNPDTGDEDTRAVGGFIGYARKAGSIIITNSTVKNIDITGPCVGGFFGYIENNTQSEAWGVSPYIRIYNCRITNNDVDSNGDAVVHTIEGQKNAGGITGFFGTDKGSGSSAKYDRAGDKDSSNDTQVLGYDEDPSATSTKYKYDIEGCEVSGYTIAQKKSKDEDYGAGGLIGFAAGTTRTIMNSSVHDCIIKIEGSSAKHYMGGVVGYTGNAISGYNISSYNNTFTYQNYSKQTATICGNFIGKTGDKVIKIAGFSRQNNYRQTSETAKTIVTLDAGNGSYATNGYVIDADYMGVNTGNDHGTAMSSINSGAANVGEGAGKNYYPYVTVSPKINVGGTNILTGDGVAIVDGSPLAKLIVNERKSNDPAGNDRIKYSTITTGDNSDAALVSEMIEWGEDTTADHDIKLTTYFKEMGTPEGYLGSDFPIIAIGGGSTDYTDYIRAYINVLTNSTGTYNAAKLGANQQSNRYKIYIYPCRCINGVYQKVAETNNLKPGLSYSGSGSAYTYSMNDNFADSVQNNNQISMIDVCYCDPTATGSTAYHLYVPVLTKKLLKFDFDSYALQGTKYESSEYTSKFPTEYNASSKLAAGFDDWQTVFVQFTYSTDDVNEFLKTGKGLNWNISKSLLFNYNAKPSLAANTEYILLDNNFNVDKEYYKKKTAGDTTISDGTATDIISFNDFVDRSGSPYTHQKLMNIADGKISYTPDNTEGSYVMFNPTSASDYSNIAAYAYDENNNKVYFKKRSSETIGRYTLTINEDLKETYYLSMYAYKEDNPRAADPSSTLNDAYAFEVTCPVTFTSDVITCQRDSKHNTNIYLGDFLKQTMTMSNVTGRQAMSADSSILRATMTSEISFDGDNATYFHRRLAGEPIYQGFYLYLDRHNYGGQVEADSTIKGQPSYKYTRTKDGVPIGGETTDIVDEGAPYIDFGTIQIDIPAYFDGWKSTQTVSVTIDYGTNDAKIVSEFPPNSGAQNDGRGIGFEGKVRLDFNDNQVKYSNKIEEEKRSERYYIDRSKSGGALTLTAIDQESDDGYDMYGEQSHNRSPLGVNGNYIRTGNKYDAELGDYEYIAVGMDYDVSNLTVEDIFDNAHDLNIKIELEQKVNDDTEGSSGFKYVPVNIDDIGGTDIGYLKDFKFFDRTGEGALVLTHCNDGGDDGYNYYTYSMRLNPATMDSWPIKYTDTGAQKDFIGNMEFYVKTNEELEKVDGYLYSNYRLKMTVSISGTAYSSTDKVVWTNAKINAEYVKPKKTT